MEIKQTTKWKRLAEVMEPYSKDWKGFDPQSLVSTRDNILLTDGKDNYALFEKAAPQVYTGHYLFGNARGSRAVKVGKAILRHLFENYEVSVVEGKTPLYMKGALLINKRLGFLPVHQQEIDGKRYQLVVLTKERFYDE